MSQKLGPSQPPSSAEFKIRNRYFIGAPSCARSSREHAWFLSFYYWSVWNILVYLGLKGRFKKCCDPAPDVAAPNNAAYPRQYLRWQGSGHVIASPALFLPSGGRRQQIHFTHLWLLTSPSASYAENYANKAAVGADCRVSISH